MNSNHLFHPTSGCRSSKPSRAMGANMPGSFNVQRREALAPLNHQRHVYFSGMSRNLFVCRDLGEEEGKKKTYPRASVRLVCSRIWKTRGPALEFHLSDGVMFLWIHNAGPFGEEEAVFNTHTVNSHVLPFWGLLSLLQIFETEHSFINATKGFPPFCPHLERLLASLIYIFL